MQGWYGQLAKTARIRPLALNWFDGPRHMIGRKPYPEPSDLKGVKVRVPPVPTWQKTFEPLGAIPTTVEAAETYSALSQGVIDAGESPMAGLRANRWYEVVKNITLTGHFNLFTGWVIGDNAFQSLSEGDRAIMMEEFIKGGQELTQRSAALNGQIRKEFEAAGVKFFDANIPAYRKATSPFYASFPQWPAGLFEKVRAAASGT
jgi:TRAP-type C4-dicarboxylate transport system substrate-binding protein